MSKIISCEEIGEFDTYDLEVDHPDHQYYLSNGILTSNSHAISYSILSVQTAWLKTHYPTEFMCALLNGQDPNSDSAQEYIAECKRLGIKITPPNINLSAENYKVIGDKTIATGLSAIKGLGPAAIGELIKNQPYKNFIDFLIKGNSVLKLKNKGEEIPQYDSFTAYEWIDYSNSNGIKIEKGDKQESEAFIGKSAIQSLAQCGAFDDFGLTRKDIYENYETYRTKVKSSIKKSKLPVESDFEKLDEEWERKDLLMHERDVMGRPLSGDSHEIFKGFFKGGSDTLKFKDIKFLKTGAKVKVEGIVKTLSKEFKIKNGPKVGRKFGKYLIEDLEGNTTSLTLWTEHYEKFMSKFKDGIPFKAICQVGEYMEEKSLNLVDMMEIFGVKKLDL